MCITRSASGFSLLRPVTVSIWVALPMSGQTRLIASLVDDITMSVAFATAVLYWKVFEKSLSF